MTRLDLIATGPARAGARVAVNGRSPETVGAAGKRLRAAVPGNWGARNGDETRLPRHVRGRLPRHLRGVAPGKAATGLGYASGMSGSGRARDTSVQSVDRAVSILQVLAAQGPAGVTEVAEALGIHKSTVFRLLATLEARGLVEQDAERGRYRIGYTVVELAGGATRGNDLSLLSRPICRELATAVGETVNLAVHDGLAVISIDQVIGSAAITSIDWVGKRTPMHATAAGKVFLAHMPQEQAGEILTQPLERFTPHTVTDPGRLKEELQAVRERGYAATSQEHEIGLAALAAPIRSLDGQVIAAVTLSGPTFRVNDDTVPGLAERLMAAGDQISWRKGYAKRG